MHIAIPDQEPPGLSPREASAQANPWNIPWNNSTLVLLLNQSVMVFRLGCTRPLEGAATKVCPNGNFCYHSGVNRKLTDQHIDEACRELLASRRRVGVRTVMAELRRRHGAAGRTERVSRVLREAEESATPPAREAEGEPNVAELNARLRAAEERAARAEELERRHQDFWARRYAEKADELERRYAAMLRTRAAITPDEYLRLQRRVAELSRRLERYEAAGPRAEALPE